MILRDEKLDQRSSNTALEKDVMKSRPAPSTSANAKQHSSETYAFFMCVAEDGA